MFHFIYRRKLLQISMSIEDLTTTTNANLLFLHNPSFLRSISSISNPNSTDQSSFTVSYLIKSCGLSPESALSASKKIQLKTTENADSVLKLFRNHGFTKTQIPKMITKFPSLLLSDPDETLKPKIEFFNRCGISSPDLTMILSSRPSVLKGSLKNQIIPSFDFLRSLLHTNENISVALKRSGRLLQYNIRNGLAPNISILRDHGVAESKILKLVMTQPGTVLLNTYRFSEIVEFVKKVGIDPKGWNFINAIYVMASMSKLNWDRKVAIYRSLELSEDEFFSAFRMQPMCMVTSEEKIRKLAVFLQNEMGFNMSMISRCPNIFLCSLEKRIVPRCSVLRMLMSKGLINSFHISVLSVCEKEFLERFVIKNQENVPELLSVYQGTVGSVGFGSLAGTVKL